MENTTRTPAATLDEAFRKLLERDSSIAADGGMGEELKTPRMVYLKAALRLLQMWKIEQCEQLHLLDLNAHEPGAIVSILKEREVEISDATLERCETLLAIFRALIRRKPDHASFAPWIHSPNQDLGWRSPRDLLNQGRDGFLRVLQILEARDQNLAS